MLGYVESSILAIDIHDLLRKLLSYLNYSMMPDHCFLKGSP